jgi:hypothetical protein
MKPGQDPPVVDSLAMNTPHRRFCGLRAAAFLSLALVTGGALRAEAGAKPDVPPGVLKKYDKNKDGTLDETEAAKWEADKAERREKDRKAREERLQKYDTDTDGKLSEAEKAAAKLAMEKERTERDMVKGKEKAQERIAREKAEKEKLAGGTAGGASENASETGQAASAAKAENASEKAAGAKEEKAKEKEKREDSMMMTP